MPRKDFVPDSAQGLQTWSSNYLLEIDAIAMRIGWPAGQVTALKLRLTNIHDAAQAVLDKQNDLDIATGLLNQAKDTELSEIRRDTNNLKSTRGFTDGDARTLEVASGSDEFDPDSYKPSLAAESKPGRISITGKKLGVDALNLYVRLKGELTWRLLAGKRARFPYEDNTPPVTPGQPEEREYRAIGVIGDDEIGQPSNIDEFNRMGLTVAAIGAKETSVGNLSGLALKSWDNDILDAGIELLQNCKLTVATDSGPAHLAVLCGAPLKVIHEKPGRLATRRGNWYMDEMKHLATAHCEPVLFGWNNPANVLREVEQYLDSSSLTRCPQHSEQPCTETPHP